MSSNVENKFEIDMKDSKNIRFYRAKRSENDDQGDFYQLLSLVLGIVAFVFKIKWCCWISLIFLISSWVNSKYNSDSKQILMNFSLIFFAFFMVYMPQKNAPSSILSS